MIDITVPMRAGMPQYPGDHDFLLETVADFGPGSPCRLSRAVFSVHTGTHVDAPAHFLPGGATIDMLPVDFFCGPARVAACAGPVVDASAVEAARPRAGEFLLFRTANSPLWSDAVFCPHYAALDLGGAEALVAAGVRGVGLDYLSVEKYGGDGAVHRCLLRANLAVIEGLNLSGVTPGEYELICLPLLLAGAEGAPARAVLIGR